MNDQQWTKFLMDLVSMSLIEFYLRTCAVLTIFELTNLQAVDLKLYRQGYAGTLSGMTQLHLFMLIISGDIWIC